MDGLYGCQNDRYIPYNSMFFLDWGFLSHDGFPKSYILDWDFYFINHPAIGVSPFKDTSIWVCLKILYLQLEEMIYDLPENLKWSSLLNTRVSDPYPWNWFIETYPFILYIYITIDFNCWCNVINDDLTIRMVDGWLVSFLGVVNLLNSLWMIIKWSINFGWHEGFWPPLVMPIYANIPRRIVTGSLDDTTCGDFRCLSSDQVENRTAFHACFNQFLEGRNEAVNQNHFSRD